MPEPEEAFNFYGKSKIVAERKSWEYISEIKKHGSNLELITLHPGGIIGPTLTKDTSFTSMQMIKKCFSGEYPRLPFISSSYTDVRDLALMHYNALQVPILDTNCHIIWIWNWINYLNNIWFCLINLGSCLPLFNIILLPRLELNWMWFLIMVIFSFFIPTTTF